MVTLLQYTPDKSHVITIAASNTPIAKQRQADFVCDLTNVVEVVTAAITQLRTDGSITLTGHDQDEGADYSTAGGEIHFLSGDYLLDETLTITGPHHLALTGENGAVLKGTMTDLTNVIEITGTSFDFGLNRLRVEGLTITGNYTSDTVRSGAGLFITDCQYTTIQNNHFIANGGSGFHIDLTSVPKGAQDHTIAHNQSIGNYLHGFFIGAIHDVVFLGNHIEENGRSVTLAGNGFRSDNSTNLNLTANNIEDNTAGSGKIVYISGVFICSIVGGDIEGDVDILLADGDSGNDIRIDNHISGDLTITPDGTNIKVDLRGQVSDVVIDAGSGGGIVISGGRYDSLDLTAFVARISEVQCLGALDFVGVELSTSGGKFDPGTITADSVSIVGSTKDMSLTSATTITVAESLLFMPGRCQLTSAGTATFKASAAQAHFVIDGIFRFSAGDLFIDGDGNAGVRLDLRGSHRLVDIAIEDIDVLRISGNFSGTGTIAVVDCDEVCTISGNAFYNDVDVTVDTTSTCQGIIASNAGTSTSSVVVTGTGTLANWTEGDNQAITVTLPAS